MLNILRESREISIHFNRSGIHLTILSLQHPSHTASLVNKAERERGKPIALKAPSRSDASHFCFHFIAQGKSPGRA